MYRKAVAAVGMAVLLNGCASGLNSFQKSELDRYEARGLVVQEKSPGLAAGLGLLPGGGSFYTREYGFGVVNLLLWPLSIIWDPVGGYDTAKVINYQATKAKLDAERDKDLNALDSQLQLGQIDMTQYTLEKRKIESKYK
ncbi:MULTISPECIES: hypothetical protein [Pseudomonas]|uniref:Lipoprotein n=1 Tax=Pseudomonas lutea TaxID=243924 RepID=A0A9X8MDS2_9PSED|nr:MULTISPECIES: hypothetical protein [Pseudomonas]SEQ74329.1 hypothetical protein SAMN05216409_108114 [Pseudomonas lutea]